MRTIVISGQKVNAPCETCGRFQESTWGYYPFRLEDGTEVDNVMQAKCDTCGSFTAVAGQATHRVKGALDERAKHRTRVRLPLELIDLMGARLNRVGADPTDYEMFLRALFVTAHEQEHEVTELLREVEDPVLEQPALASINVTISPRVGELLTRLKVAAGLGTSEVLRRLLVLADGALSSVVEQQLRRGAYVTA